MNRQQSTKENDMKTILFSSLLFCSACGVKLGSQVVMGTTSFLEEANRGNFASNLEHRVRENLTEDDRSKLSVRLAEVK